MDNDLKREVILDNYSNPSNRGRVDNKDYIYVNSNNSSCIDNIDLYILIENNTIKDIKFDGEACAISTASTSIMTKELIGKTLDEALDFITNFDNMINEKAYDENKFNEAIVFNEIYKQENRKTCATLPYIGIKEAIEKYKNSNID